MDYVFTPKCKSNEDCSSFTASKCYEGKCIACETSEDCEHVSGFETDCCQGKCISDEIDYECCTYADCSDGLACVNYKCVPCTEDSQCPQVCLDSVCF